MNNSAYAFGILILMLFCGLKAFGQELQFSEEFDCFRKVVPLKILNNHPNYFSVLRYNKIGHDFTIERRRKADFSIVAFTPLRLDSVNAGWFNYEQLNYKCFAYESKLFFVFEKTLNSKSTVYVKSIDSSGTSSGFKEMAFMENDAGTIGSKFQIIPSGNCLLIVGEHYYHNSTAKKTLLLYDLRAEKNIWVKKLPLENEYTGFSIYYSVNSSFDLFAVIDKARVAYYQRKFIKNQQTAVPVFLHDSVFVLSLLNDGNKIFRKRLSIQDSVRLNGLSLLPTENELLCMAHLASEKGNNFGEVYFFAEKFSKDLQKTLFTTKTSNSNNIKNSLTFYDGGDYDAPYDKTYNLVESHSLYAGAWLMEERKEENFHKELIFWKTHGTDGRLLYQHILPRKIFYFDDRMRFRNIASVTAMQRGEHQYFVVLENSANTDTETLHFDFHRFSTQRNLWNGTMTLYKVDGAGDLTKSVLYQNSDYDFVPVVYEGSSDDPVFYFNKGKQERFAILKWNP